jgi:hypothetical protein
MTNDEKQWLAYRLFKHLGFCIFLLTILVSLIGAPEEVLLLLPFLPGSVVLLLALELIILGLYALAFTAMVLALQCKGDGVLSFLGVITIPYFIFVANNIFYFFHPLVMATDIVVVVSLAYSAACIAAAVGNWWFRFMNRDEA